MKVAIIKYNAGNIYSVQCALKRLEIDPVVTADHHVLLSADKVIFPGVGEAAAAMADLHRSGLDRLIPCLPQPVLGICIGMQLMCRYSEEGHVNGLGIFDAEVKKFRSPDNRFKIPHVGWNTVRSINNESFPGFLAPEYVYYVHSYYVPVNSFTTAVTEYIHPFSAALCKDNFYACQFHPEKSGETGMRVLENFLAL